MLYFHVLHFDGLMLSLWLRILPLVLRGDGFRALLFAEDDQERGFAGQ
jgi:hypothetical protein